MVKIQTRKENIGLEKVGSFMEVYAVMADIYVRVLSKVCIEPNNSGNVRHLSKSIASRVAGEPSKFGCTRIGQKNCQKNGTPLHPVFTSTKVSWHALLSAA
jgi:hypothetical protein